MTSSLDDVSVDPGAAPVADPAGGRAAANAAVVAAARAAGAAAGAVAAASDEAVGRALRAMARRLMESADVVIAANTEDHAAASAGGMSRGLLDRLRLDRARLESIAGQLTALADIAPEPRRRPVRPLGDGLVLEEWQRPVGVIGANFEARPNVVVDIASQLIKSGNVGVLRTGSAALGSAATIVDHVIGPALSEAGLPAGAIQLVRVRGRESAEALVSQTGLIRLVILRGSGDSTRELGRTAALHDVRTLAHADGGAVIYLDGAADPAKASALVDASLDRLGVCNRLNLLLVHQSRWDDVVPSLVAALAARTPAITASLPPHGHPIGYEWALDPTADATVTIAPVSGVAEAVRLANDETSGLAAAIVTEDGAAAREFLRDYVGTGAFWNATPRLLDGFKLLAVPETGINVDRVPGPRGPVTYRDLYLRQYIVVPAAHASTVHSSAV
jgi:glutamate-5-semialdehyde dehydrogenase